MFITSNVRLYSQIKKTYHPQTLVEEWKYEIKKPKMENLIDDELESSSSDESDCETESDNESDNESNE